MRLSVSFPNRRNLAPSQQGEEQGVGLGGWAGGRVGMCGGRGQSVCEGRRHVSPGEHVSATAHTGRGLRGWVGEGARGNRVCFCEGVCARR